jgi:AcrR family transcriptional regulator
MTARRTKLRGQGARGLHKGAAPRSGRTLRRGERRDAILAAALAEFSARGFAATRLDDVCRRAGVAKGTIYLYFQDKESLFQELIRSQLSPVVGTLEAAMAHDVPVRMLAQQIVDVFVREIYGTSRKDIIRLVISEGSRFPQLAEFYYREVLARIFGALRVLLQRAAERGELRSDAVIRFPQLVGAPAVIAIIWNGLFGEFAPLDVRELMSTHLDLLFGERSEK